MKYLTNGETVTGVAVAVCVGVVAYSLWNASPPTEMKELLSAWESVFKIGAVVGAGIFFAFKALGGYNNLNLSVMPSSRRVFRDEKMDHIEVHVVIEKGASSAFSMEGIVVLFTPQGGQPIGPIRMGTERLRLENGIPTMVQPLTPTADGEPLYVAPGDKMQFGCSAVVPGDLPCLAEIVVFGRRKRRGAFQAQWRASVVSLPDAVAMRRISD
jgi:hypothetical protein